MITHTFQLPTLLEAHLKSGGYKLSDTELQHLKARLRYLDSPRPKLWDGDRIEFEHSLWSSDAAKHYLGTDSDQHSPGSIDPNRILIIGEADEDSPLALDFRGDNPRVIYLGAMGPKSFWIELAPSYERFIDSLRGEQ